jgi:hypothetical protein
MFGIFHKLGGADKAVSVIEAATGSAPPSFVLRKWRSLGRIPPIRAVILLDECARRGIPANYEQDCISSKQHEAAE